MTGPRSENWKVQWESLLSHGIFQSREERLGGFPWDGAFSGLSHLFVCLFVFFLSELQAAKSINQSPESHPYQSVCWHRTTQLALGTGVGEGWGRKTGYAPHPCAFKRVLGTEGFPLALSSEQLRTNSLKALKSISPAICDIRGPNVHDLPEALRKKEGMEC